MVVNGNIYANICVFNSAACNDGENQSYGSLNYDENVATIEEDQTYVLEDYKVECSGYVNAWEFCYQAQRRSTLTFYPGIWKRIKENFSLIQSSVVTFTANRNMHSCQKFNLSIDNQFWVPKNTFVGLYSNGRSSQPLLLAVKTNCVVNIHRASGNQSSIMIEDDYENDCDNEDDGENDSSSEYDDHGSYNIAIKVYIGEQIYLCIKLGFFCYKQTTPSNFASIPSDGLIVSLEPNGELYKQSAALYHKNTVALCMILDIKIRVVNFLLLS